jgi:hypothetical protein
MLKLNTFGLLKKCRELFRASRIAAANFISPLSLDDLLIVEEDFTEEEEEIEEIIEETEEPEYDLEPIRSFIDEYIGLVIVNFTPFKNDVENLENNLSGKIITGVKILENKLQIKVVSLSGKTNGVIEMSPSLTGQFAERYNQDDPDSSSRYRIIFLGGHSIEYLDNEDNGSITYYDYQSEMN